MIDEVKQAEAVALMRAQVCLHLTLTCVCTVARAPLLQQCRALNSLFEPHLTSHRNEVWADQPYVCAGTKAGPSKAQAEA